MSVAKNYLSENQSNIKGKFENPVVDKFTRVNSFIPITLFYVTPVFLITYGILYSSISYYSLVILFISGALFFTFIEYMLHRYLFHMDTSVPWKKKMQYNIHGMHHDYPKDKDRLAMPLIASIPLAVTLFFLINLLMGDNVFAFLPGIMTGYSTYLLVHYVVHAYPPPKNFLKELWINHSIHHYREEDQAFGVSSPLWDYVFGTMPKKKKQENISG